MDEAEGLSFFLERQRKEEGQDGPFIHPAASQGTPKGADVMRRLIPTAAAVFLHGAGQIILYRTPNCFYCSNKLLLFFFLPSRYAVYVNTYNTKSINRSSRNIPFIQNFTKEQDIKKEPKT